MFWLSVVSALSAVPALSADLGGPRPAPRQPVVEVYRDPGRYDWSGTYFGLSAGYGWGTSEHSYDRGTNHGTASQSPEGWLGAVTLGYNYMLSPSLLVGIEGDLGLMSLDADDKVIFDGHVWKTHFGSTWGTLRGRLGFALDRLLIFGTAGVAFMGVDEVAIGDAAGQTAENTDFRSGWVVGGGVEYALTSSISTKIEYLHMDFGKYDGLSENREAFYFDNKVDVVRMGLNFKF